jgi:hypothetical protein
VALALATLGIAAAQESPPAQDPFGASPESDLTKLTTEKLVERASGYVDKMEDWLTDSFQLLQQSISAGDLNAANTRNEAITVMKGLVKLSEQNLMNMRQKGRRRRSQARRERVRQDLHRLHQSAGVLRASEERRQHRRRQPRALLGRAAPRLLR